jgi:glucokinase
VKEIIAQAACLIRHHAGMIVAVGVAAAPVLDLSDGRVVRWGMRPTWQGLRFRNLLKEELRLPVVIGNDVNLACLGEWEALPRSKRPKVLATVSVGTGLGSGIIIDGEIFSGSRGQAGDLGHVLYDRGGAHCYCGADGCLQTVGSGYGIVRMAREFSARQWRTAGNPTHLSAPDRWTAKMLACRGAKINWVQDAFERGAEAVAWGVHEMYKLFDPERIVICGGVMNARQLFEKPLLKFTMDLGLSTVIAMPVVKQGLAAALGGALLARRSVLWSSNDDEHREANNNFLAPLK